MVCLLYRMFVIPPCLLVSCDCARVVDQGLLDFDPFARIDEEGVGSLIRTALEKARAKQPETKVKTTSLMIAVLPAFAGGGRVFCTVTVV